MISDKLHYLTERRHVVMLLDIQFNTAFSALLAHHRYKESKSQDNRELNKNVGGFFIWRGHWRIGEVTNIIFLWANSWQRIGNLVGNECKVVSTEIKLQRLYWIQLGRNEKLVRNWLGHMVFLGEWFQITNFLD